MRTTVLFAAALLAAAPAFAQKTNDQVTEEGRQTNNALVSDATLTTKVHTALMNQVGLNTLKNINVDSNNGVVTLKGRVDSQETRNRAAEVARRVSGVTQVKNELRVKGG